MDTFEFNKIAGAVLAALLLAVGTTTFIEIRMSHKAEKPGYTLPVKVAATPGEAAKPQEAFSVEKVGHRRPHYRRRARVQLLGSGQEQGRHLDL